MVCRNDRKKVGLIRAISAHWRVVGNKSENLAVCHVIGETEIQREKVQTFLWP